MSSKDQMPITYFVCVLGNKDTSVQTGNSGSDVLLPVLMVDEGAYDNVPGKWASAMIFE